MKRSKRMLEPVYYLYNLGPEGGLHNHHVNIWGDQNGQRNY